VGIIGREVINRGHQSLLGGRGLFLQFPLGGGGLVLQSLLAGIVLLIFNIVVCLWRGIKTQCPRGCMRA
jgi:hypothetical protein